MTKIAKLSILLSFLGLWLTSFIKNEIQIIVGFILILSFGICHGANDLLIIKKIYSEESKSYWRILLKYLVIVLLGAVLFILIPSVAMLLFIVVSSYHFGEQHWENKYIFGNKIISTSFYTIYGSFILLLIFQFHTKEVINILYEITNVNLTSFTISLLLKIDAFLLLFLFLYNFYKSIEFQKNLVIELVYLVVFAIIFKVGSLIWAFTIYFIFWHSIPSLFNQIKFLYGKVTVPNFKSYIKSAFAYWLISIIGIFLLYFLLKGYKIFDSIFFSFLAAITFPHVFVIERMFNVKPKKTE